MLSDKSQNKPFGQAQRKPMITFDDFAKLDMRVGEVVEAAEVVGSEKLVELKVDFGPDFAKASSGKHRTIYAGIKKWYPPEKLVGRKLMFVVNLAPKKFKINDQEYESQGMMMAALRQAQGKLSEAVLYVFDKDLPSGTIMR